MVGPDFSDWLTNVLIKIKIVKHQIKAMPTPIYAFHFDENFQIKTTYINYYYYYYYYY